MHIDRTEFIKKVVEKLNNGYDKASFINVSDGYHDDKYLITYNDSGSENNVEFGVRICCGIKYDDDCNDSHTEVYEFAVVKNPGWLDDRCVEIRQLFESMFEKELKIIEEENAPKDEDPVATEVSVC